MKYKIKYYPIYFMIMAMGSLIVLLYVPAYYITTAIILTIVSIASGVSIEVKQ